MVNGQSRGEFVDDGTMSLDQRRFGRLVSRHALLILVITILGAVVAAAFVFTRPASYTASTQLRVANPLSLADIQQINQNNRTVVTVADQIATLSSDSFKEQVKLKSGETDFSSSFATPGTGQVVTITVTAKSADTASKVATAYDDVYLANLAARNKPLFDSTVSELTDNISSLNTQLNTLNSSIANASQATIAQVQPQINALLGQKSDLNKQLTTIQLTQAATPSGDAQVVSATTTKKDGDSIITILIGAVAGLLIGLIVAGIREAKFGTILDESDAERYGLAVVATVAAPLPRRMRTAVAALAPGRDTSAYREPAVLLAPPHATDIAKRWLVTSPDRDGIAGAVLAGRLARSVAQAGRRVVIVDTAAGSQSRVGGSSQAGLAEVLRGDVPIAQGLALDAGSNVAVMGPGNGLDSMPEPLASPNFAGLLDSLGDRFDVILVTGAPFERSADSYVLAPLVNLIVVALQRGVTKRKTLGETTPHLAAVSGDVEVGAVLIGGRVSALARGGPEGGEPAVETRRAPRPAATAPARGMALNRMPLPGSSN
jgi:Mrp family chromosome partitioning ATPase/ElaB/YqjD/DUF883 family membrane-anchored ribosome-binding protein